MLVNFSTVSSLLVFAATISAYPVDPPSPTVNLGYTQYQGTNFELRKWNNTVARNAICGPSSW
jgi:hypothetical protein